MVAMQSEEAVTPSAICSPEYFTRGLKVSFPIVATAAGADPEIAPKKALARILESGTPPLIALSLGMIKFISRSPMPLALIRLPATTKNGTARILGFIIPITIVTNVF